MQRIFTERVDEANELFAQAAGRAGAEVEEHPHPVAGRYGESLKTLVARLGPEQPQHVFATVSGTHGIEGHTGSAIQIALLDHVRRHGAPKGLGLLFVHLINPWGCSWNRRENEVNIDIFRNLIYTEPPFAENLQYERYEVGINPRRWTGPEREAADRVFAQFVEDEGWDSAVAVIRKGQHKYPLGVTYHGVDATWSRKVVEDVGRRLLQGVRNVTVMDIHTGYGDSGAALIVPYDLPETPKGQFICSRFADNVFIPGEVSLIPAHPRAPYEIWQKAGGPRVLFIGLEMGTHDVEAAFEVFRANTYIHTYGSPHDEFGQATSKAYRELFYPASATWREQVAENGLNAVLRAMEVAMEAERVL